MYACVAMMRMNDWRFIFVLLARVRIKNKKNCSTVAYGRIWYKYTIRRYKRVVSHAMLVCMSKMQLGYHLQLIDVDRQECLLGTVYVFVVRIQIVAHNIYAYWLAH